MRERTPQRHNYSHVSKDDVSAWYITGLRARNVMFFYSSIRVGDMRMTSYKIEFCPICPNCSIGFFFFFFFFFLGGGGLVPNTYAAVSPSRRTVFTKWCGTWPSRGSYGAFVAITDSLWQNFELLNILLCLPPSTKYSPR